MNHYKFLASLIVMVLVVSGCNSSQPPKPGMFLKSGNSQVELNRVRGKPQTVGLPQTNDVQPIIAFYLPLDDVKQIEWRGPSGRISFDAISAKDQVYEIKSSSPLVEGIYCLSLGGPLMSPNDVSYWCFQVGTSVSYTEPVTPTGEAQVAVPTVAVVNVTLVPSTSTGTLNTVVKGRIAFIAQGSDSKDDIFTVNADGTGLTNLTNKPANYSYVTWSPDGNRIGFVSQSSDTQGIYVINADGSGLTRLTTWKTPSGFEGVSSIFAWSPDSKRIAFFSDHDGNYDIYAINADGSGLTNFTKSAALEALPAWSPDSKQIAYVTVLPGPNNEIYVMNADGSMQTRLTNDKANDSFPTWLRNDNRIAFVRNNFGSANEVYILNRDGSGQKRIMSIPATGGLPVWSFDGKRFAFYSHTASGVEIQVANVDGTGFANLTNGRAQEFFPAWSSDGTHIAFVSPSADGSHGEIYVMNADGSGRAQVTSNSTASSRSPTWQP